jgi:hypothetical protein
MFLNLERLSLLPHTLQDDIELLVQMYNQAEYSTQLFLSINIHNMSWIMSIANEKCVDGPSMMFWLVRTEKQA